LEDVDQEKGKVFVEFTPQGTVTAATIRLIDRKGQALEVTCPTVTESFSIVESEEAYDQYAPRK
jgi:4-hydroxy-3-methylbut-2-enyl diphosphate reductase IspH